MKKCWSHPRLEGMEIDGENVGRSVRFGLGIERDLAQRYLSCSTYPSDPNIAARSVYLTSSYPQSPSNITQLLQLPIAHTPLARLDSWNLNPQDKDVYLWWSKRDNGTPHGGGYDGSSCQGGNFKELRCESRRVGPRVSCKLRSSLCSASS